MALTFYLSTDNSDLGDAAGFNRYLNSATGTAGSIEISLGHNDTQRTGYAFTRSGDLDSAIWHDESIAVNVRVTSAADIDLRLSAARVNDSGVIQSEGAVSDYISLNSTGVKTFTIGSNGGWGTPSDGDRLRIDYDFFYPSGSKGGRNITIETNTVDSSVETPFALFAAPTISTNAASNQGLTSATLNGNLTSLGDVNTADVFFQYKLSTSEIWTSTTKQTRTETGTFSQSISSLTHNSTYDFRAVVEYENSGTQTAYGSTLTFNTLAFSTPSIETSAASSVDESSATLNGDLTSLGDSSVVDVFFRYKEVSATEWVATTKQNRSTTGVFNQLISGLSSNTEYQFYAVVEYDDLQTGEVTGSTLTFTTSASGLIVTLNPTISVNFTAGYRMTEEGTLQSSAIIDGSFEVPEDAYIVEITLTDSGYYLSSVSLGSIVDESNFTILVSNLNSTNTINIGIGNYILLESTTTMESEGLGTIELAVVLLFSGLGEMESKAEANLELITALVFSGLAEMESEAFAIATFPSFINFSSSTSNESIGFALTSILKSFYSEAITETEAYVQARKDISLFGITEMESEAYALIEFFVPLILARIDANLKMKIIGELVEFDI